MIRLSPSLSALASALMLAAPAVAQDSAQQAASGGTAQQAASGGAAQEVAQETDAQRAAARDLDRALEALGAERQGPFLGAVIRARTEAGHEVGILAGAEDFAPGEIDDAMLVRLGDLPDRLIGAGMTLVQPELDRIVRQGLVDGHEVLALGGPASPALPAARDESGGADIEAVRERLSAAEMELAEEIEVAVFRATGEGGLRYLLVFGREGFAAGALDLDRDDLRSRLAEAGLQEVSPVEEGDIHVVRGSGDGVAVLALAGPALDEIIREED